MGEADCLVTDDRDLLEMSPFTAVIDKLEHLNRYAVWRHDPYHYCLEVLLERYVLWLHYRGANGDVMGEVRGGSADRRLERSFSRHYKNGTRWVRRDVMQKRLTSSSLKLKRNDKNIAGLQIADVLAHPSALYIRSIHAGDVEPIGFGRQIVDLLVESQYNRSWKGVIEGFGIKWLP